MYTYMIGGGGAQDVIEKSGQIPHGPERGTKAAPDERTPHTQGKKGRSPEPRQAGGRAGRTIISAPRAPWVAGTYRPPVVVVVVVVFLFLVSFLIDLI
jgi:hypothetical protein